MKTPAETFILIVDDEPDLREAIAFDFRRKGFQVLTAACGNDAFDIVNKQHVDIVLSDVRMPNGTGIELLDRIKARNAVTPVVMFITGFSDLSIDEAYEKGAEAVFAKPFDRKALLAAVMKSIEPINERYERKSARVDSTLQVGLKFLGSNYSANSETVNLARGGLFVGLKDQFPKLNEEVEFNFLPSLGIAAPLMGSGIVRWVRKESVGDLPAGCGIEFVNLEKETSSRMLELINQVKTKAFIPRR